MLIVQSEDPVNPDRSVRRIRSRELEGKMETLWERCKADENYYSLPCPRKSKIIPRPAVRAALNKEAIKLAGAPDGDLPALMSRLRLYVGETRTTRPATKPPNI